jgi:monoterpene epsilon-lactone hydrolase
VKKGPSKYLRGVSIVLSAPQNHDAAAEFDARQRLQQRRQLSDTEQPSVDESVRVIPLQVAGCAAEWIVAPGADESTRVLMIHGGGFVMCGLNSHRNTSIMLSKYANCAVLAIDYRLAPETPFPGGLDDCVGAWRYLLDNGPQGGSAASHAYVMGDSAGGNLAASLLLRMRDEGGRTADGAILMSATLDLTCSSPSWISNNASDVMLGNPALAPGGPLTSADREWVGLYLGAGDPAQPLASPLLADLAGLPPLLIMVGEEERLRDDSVRFHDKATAAGVISRLECWPHVYHAWTSINVVVPEADLALRRMGEFIKRENYKQVAAERFASFVDLSDAMAENARRWPQHPAVIEGERRLNWAEFDAQLNQMANALIAQGIRPNDKVAALARNSLEYMVVMFGTLRAGACIVPLSGMASSEALAAMMDNSDASVFFL